MFYGRGHLRTRGLGAGKTVPAIRDALLRRTRPPLRQDHLTNALLTVSLRRSFAEDNPAALLEKPLETFDGDRRAEVKALEFVAMLGREKIELLARLNPFGHDVQLQAVREHDDRGRDFCVMAVAGNIADE